MAGGVFEGLGLVVGGTRHLTPRETRDLTVSGRAVLLDIREDYLVAMKRFEVPGVVWIPRGNLPSIAASIPLERPLIVADSSGVYTKEAAAWLRAAGFTDVACLNGGMLAWDNADMPVATDAGALLHGDCACVMRSRNDGG